MSEYDDTNRGACWPNHGKKTDQHPDYRGSLNVEGSEYWVSMWINVEATGNQPPIKFSIREKEVKEVAAASSEDLEAIKALARGPDKDKPFDDDIPF